MPEPIYSGPFMGLPHGLEAVFWSSSECIKAYSTWDGIAAVNQLVSALLLAKMLWPLLIARDLLDRLWYIHVVVALNASVAVATAWLLHRRPRLYAQHRHAVVVTNRLMRLATTVLAAVYEGPWLTNGMVHRVSLRPLGETVIDGTSTRAQLLAAAHIARSVTLPMLVMTQGFWAFRVAHWAPIQLLNVLISCQWVLARTPCVMTLEMPSAMLLEPTCRAMSQVYDSLVGSLHGYHSPSGNHAACGDPITAARAICWFGWWSYALLTLTTGFVRLEWRVKAAWVKSFTGRHLAWGPRTWLLGLPDSDADGGGSDGSSSLQQLATWVVAVPTALSLLWAGLLWLLPKLPLPIECRAADYMQQGGDKRFEVVNCGESILCQSAGMSVALIMSLQLVCMLFLHLKLLA